MYVIPYFLALIFPYNLSTTQEKTALQKAGVDYSPLHYFISPGAAKNTGFSFEHVLPIAKSRWGFDDAIRNVCEPIAEGPYWPVRATDNLL